MGPYHANRRPVTAYGVVYGVHEQHLKEARTKIFQSTHFLKKYIYFSQIMSYLCQKCKKEDNEIKRVGNYLDFEKLVHVIQHGLQELIVKTIKSESKEASDLSHIL